MNHPGGLIARNEWEIHFVEAGAKVDINEVDAAEFDFDDGVIGTRGGVGHVGQLQLSRAAELLDLNGFHDRSRAGDASASRNHRCTCTTDA